MYIVVIAWMFVVVLMAVSQNNVTAGVLTLFFYGLAPCALLLWLLGGPSRKRAKELQQVQPPNDHAPLSDPVPGEKSVPDNNMDENNRTNAKTD